VKKRSVIHPVRKIRSAIICLSVFSAFALVIGARIARAANISGSMVYRNGAAADKRQLHFENRTTGDMYVAPTQPDGTFIADVPPGFYDLRAERGVILVRKIRIDQNDVNVGRVIEPPMLDVHRPFQREGVAGSQLVSPAPATANLAGRPIEAMKYGHEAMAPIGGPVGTPVPRSTPFAENPRAQATPAATEYPSATGYPSSAGRPSLME
jgi:hypothetical protein